MPRILRLVLVSGACGLLSVTCSAGNHSQTPTSSTGGGAGGDAADAGANGGANAGANSAADAAADAAPAPTLDAAVDASPQRRFEPVPAGVYVAKVKNLLLGLPPSDAEIATVTADPTQFRALIASWQQLPQYSRKMRRFFELAFQQTQIAESDFADQSYPQRLAYNATTTPLLIQNAEQSFARTMLETIAAGMPWSKSMTTQTLMLTTALKELYALLDVWEVNDNGKVTDAFKQANPNLTLYVGASAGAIAPGDSLAPNSPNYMHFYNPDVTAAGASVAGCASDPIAYPASAMVLHHLLLGSLDGWKSSSGVSCPPYGGSATAAQLTAGDFNDWTMVTIRRPQPGESTTRFYDLPSLRSASELVLSIPRVGFFSTPAFFANWQTNTSNQMRVTLNQALIVGLGSQVDGTDATPAPGNPPPGLDSAHAGSSDCLFCHQTLDPMRSIFAASYSWNFHSQIDTALIAQKGMFAFRGITAKVNNMNDFGVTLAGHPLFAAAWVQKLCYYANSAPCAQDDPEFVRVTGAFQNSNFDWNGLIAELFASPLVTNASETATAVDNTEVIAVERRDHLCAALDARLGFTDVCGLDAQSQKISSQIHLIATGLPSDGYGRGATVPVLPNLPTLFYRAGLENVCESVALLVIDVAVGKQLPNVKQWSSSAPDTAIADFVSIMMGLPSTDPRATPAMNLLTAHFAAAQAAFASRSDALKSVFVAACLSPGMTAIGL